jgi:hypothetical protein
MYLVASSFGVVGKTKLDLAVECGGGGGGGGGACACVCVCILDMMPAIASWPGYAT